MRRSPQVPAESATKPRSLSSGLLASVSAMGDIPTPFLRSIEEFPSATASTNPSSRPSGSDKNRPVQSAGYRLVLHQPGVKLHHVFASPKGGPPALPGRQPWFDSSGSRFFCRCGASDGAAPGRSRSNLKIASSCDRSFSPSRRGPFEGPATAKPPALPGDYYWTCRHNVQRTGDELRNGECRRRHPDSTSAKA